MNDIRISQLACKIGRWIAPERSRLLKASRWYFERHGLDRLESRPAPVLFPKQVAKGRIEKVLVAGIYPGQMPNQAFREISAAGFRRAGLTDIKPDLHQWLARETSLA